MPENRVSMFKFRIFVLVCISLAPFLSFSQSAPLVPFSQRQIAIDTGLRIRTAGYRALAPKRFTTPLFALPFLSLHRSPPDDTFIESIMLGDGADADEGSIWDTERNLRASGLFSRMETRLDTVPQAGASVNRSEVDVQLFLYERTSIAPFLLVETGGGNATSGFGASFVNIDSGQMIAETRLQHRSENAIGWQGDVRLRWRSLGTLGSSPIRVDALVQANRFRGLLDAAVIFPFSQQQLYNEWSLRLSYQGGNEFRYLPSEAASILLPANYTLSAFSSLRLNATALVSGSYWNRDFYLSGSVQLDYTERANAQFAAKSLDNTIFGIAEIGTEHRNGTLLDEQWWGKTPRFTSKSLGAMAPVGFYAQGGAIFGGKLTSRDSQSFLWGVLRASVFPTVRCGGAVLGKNIYFSVQGEALGENLARGEVKFHVALGRGVIVANRFLAVLPNGGFTIFDSENGVRGYGANTLVGASGGLLWNVELRGIPLGDFGAYKLSGTLFFDTVGGLTVENGAGVTLGNAPSGSSFGAGLRLCYPALLSSNALDGVLRLDVAFVPQVGQIGRFGQIILSTQEAFTLFDDFPARQERFIGTRRFVE